MTRLLLTLFLLLPALAHAQPVPARGCPPSSLTGCTIVGPLSIGSNGNLIINSAPSSPSAGDIVNNVSSYAFPSTGERPRYWVSNLNVSGSLSGATQETDFHQLYLQIPGGTTGPNITGTVSAGAVQSPLTIATPGSGLPNGTYTLFFQGGGGTGAAGTATISGGTVTSTNLTSGGSAYTTAPAIGIEIASISGEAFNIIHPYGQFDAGLYISGYGEAFESSAINSGILGSWQAHNSQLTNTSIGIVGSFTGQRCAVTNQNPLQGSFAQNTCMYIPAQNSPPASGSGGSVTATQSGGSVTLGFTAGSGYPNGTYTLTFSGGGCAVYPAGTFTVSGGAISSTALSVAGTGCTSNPTVGLYFGSLPTGDYAAQIVDQYSTFATAGNMVIGSIATQALNVDFNVVGRSTSSGEYVLFLKSNNGFNNLFYVTADGHTWIPSVVNTNGPVCGTNNGAINSGVCYVEVSSKTGNNSVLTGQTGYHFDNQGAGGTVIFTLPAAAVGLNYCFSVYAAQTVEVLGVGSDQIALGASLSVSQNITSATVNSNVCLEAHGTGLWIARSQTGTWTVH